MISPFAFAYGCNRAISSLCYYTLRLCFRGYSARTPVARLAAAAAFIWTMGLK